MDDYIYNPFQFGTIVKGEDFCNRENEHDSVLITITN